MVARGRRHYGRTARADDHDSADVVAEWDFLNETIWQSIDQASLGSDSVGDGVPPDSGAITNGVGGVSLGGDISVGPGGYIIGTPDPNDDQGEPVPDVGGGE
jgi:hypothetical protein